MSGTIWKKIATRNEPDYNLITEEAIDELIESCQFNNVGESSWIPIDERWMYTEGFWDSIKSGWNKLTGKNQEQPQKTAKQQPKKKNNTATQKKNSTGAKKTTAKKPAAKKTTAKKTTAKKPAAKTTTAKTTTAKKPVATSGKTTATKKPAAKRPRTRSRIASLVVERLRKRLLRLESGISRRRLVDQREFRTTSRRTRRRLIRKSRRLQTLFSRYGSPLRRL